MLSLCGKRLPSWAAAEGGSRRAAKRRQMLRHGCRSNRCEAATDRPQSGRRPAVGWKPLVKAGQQVEVEANGLQALGIQHLALWQSAAQLEDQR